MSPIGSSFGFLPFDFVVFALDLEVFAVLGVFALTFALVFGLAVVFFAVAFFALASAVRTRGQLSSTARMSFVRSPFANSSS